MPKKLTIREIAKMANVSPTAVSFVLNGKKGVSEKTRKKVNDIIEEMDFKPSINSKRLFFKKSFNIAVATKHTSSPFDDLFYFEITKGVFEKSKEHGYNTVFMDMDYDGSGTELPHILENKDADGIIFYQDIDNIIINKVDELGIPYVVVDSHAPSKAVCINIDYESSVYTAIRYLIENGHKDIAFIGSSYIPAFYLQTFSGYKKALEEVNIPLPPSWIQIEAMDEESSYQCMDQILKKSTPPTAVFCAGDRFAIGAMKCAKDRGYRIPEDISFMGIDDILLCRYVTPALTTIKIDKVEMGFLAMELLAQKIDGKDVKSITLTMNEVVERDSVKNILVK